MTIGLFFPPLRPPHHSPITSRLHHRFRSPRRSFFPIGCSSSSSWEREESRWLREEQRWLREEQRWLRVESRWNSEKESLLGEIKALRLRLHGRRGKQEDGGDDDDELDGIDVEVREVKLPPPSVLVEEADVKEMVLVEHATVEEEEKRKGRRILRKGAEGEDVKEMQEALEKLGFYSGEEDIEFSIFSSGTERAVKTWQASVGTREDGIMSSELLEKLFMGNKGDAGSKVNLDEANDNMTVIEKTVHSQDGINGAPSSSVTKISDIKQNVTIDGGTEVDIHKHGVFLLGENRWEEPSRLGKRAKFIDGSKATSSERCLTCHGEGRLMCIECDGTGEPNIEPQFLEWVDEAAKCPYCDGLGYTICDVCEGKSLVDN